MLLRGGWLPPGPPALPKALSVRELLGGSGWHLLPRPRNLGPTKHKKSKNLRDSVPRRVPRSPALCWHWAPLCWAYTAHPQGAFPVWGQGGHASQFPRQIAQRGQGLSTVRTCVSAEPGPGLGLPIPHPDPSRLPPTSGPSELGYPRAGAP